MCPSCTPPPNSRCYTHSWLSAQEDVQIPHHAARWSHLNWCFPSSPLPLCIVIKLPPYRMHFKSSWGDAHWPSRIFLLGLPASSSLPHGHRQARHDGPRPRGEAGCHCCGFGLQPALNFRLLQEQKLFRLGITNTLSVSLMNVGYLTKYSTFNVWFCSLCAEQHVPAITKSRILILIALIKHTLS